MAVEPLSIHIRLKQGKSVVFGPGKAQLLAGVAQTGSIAAAGRSMAMSYKRAWLLIDGLNAAFGTPLVETNRGGSAGGGAVLTARGLEILSLYNQFVDVATKATEAERSALEALLPDHSAL